MEFKYIADGNAKSYSHLKRTLSVYFLQLTIYYFLLNSVILLLDIYSSEKKIYVLTKISKQIFTEILFLIAPKWEKTNVFHLVNG